MSFDPPLRRLKDIAANARMFREKCGFWPMAGWLEQFAALGLMGWQDETGSILRQPTQSERYRAVRFWPVDGGAL